MNTLTLLETPHWLTHATINFNGAYFDHTKWSIDKNILTFEGYEIETGNAAWHTYTKNLDRIEDRFIKRYSESYGFLSLKKRTFLGVRGLYVFKERIYTQITTNIWTVIGENNERTTNKE